MQFAMFCLALGMRWPMQMDGVWEVSSGSYDPFFNWPTFCSGRSGMRGSGTAGWTTVGVVIPFEGFCACHMRQFVPHIPQSTGLKV